MLSLICATFGHQIQVDLAVRKLEQARWTRCLTVAELDRASALYRQAAAIRKDVLRPAIVRFLATRTKATRTGPLRVVSYHQAPPAGWTAADYFEELDRQLDVRILIRLIRDLPFKGDRAGYLLITETPWKRVKGTWKLVRLFEGGHYGGSFDSLAEFDYACKTRSKSLPRDPEG